MKLIFSSLFKPILWDKTPEKIAKISPKEQNIITVPSPPVHPAHGT